MPKDLKNSTNKNVFPWKLLGWKLHPLNHKNLMTDPCRTYNKYLSRWRNLYFLASRYFSMFFCCDFHFWLVFCFFFFSEEMYIKDFWCHALIHCPFSFIIWYLSLWLYSYSRISPGRLVCFVLFVFPDIAKHNSIQECSSSRAIQDRNFEWYSKILFWLTIFRGDTDMNRHVGIYFLGIISSWPVQLLLSQQLFDKV